MKEKLIIVGVGSMAPEVVDFVNRYDLYDIVGFTVDEKYVNNNGYMDKPVYPLERIEEFVDKDVKVFVAISWYNYMNKYKRQKFELLKKKGFHFANLISPLASVKCSSIGEGNWIKDFSEIGYNSQIGDNNTFTSRSSFGHYSIMGSHNVLSGATIAGNVTVGDQNYFGVGAIVFNKLKIGNKNLIGGGSVIKSNISDFTLSVSPESRYKKLNEETLEMLLSPNSVGILKPFTHKH